MKYVSGEIITANGFEEKYIGFNKGKILETGKGKPPEKPTCTGLILPKFVNFHTHIGDSFISSKNIKLPKDIEKLVAPPDGLKHKLLKEASESEIINGMEKSLDLMIKTGTKYFCDFREGGITGICYLKTAVGLWNINPFILSRPDSLEYNKDEIDLLLKNSNGIGISSISDWDYSELKKIAIATKKKNKVFALHASERIREDINSILDLKPDFLVHMLQATEEDLSIVKENDISIVLCPRSNDFFSLKPNFKLIKKIGIKFFIGTDNVMTNSPSLIDEIVFIKKKFDFFSISELLSTVSIESRKALNLEWDIHGSNSKAEFIVLDKKTLKPLYISN